MADTKILATPLESAVAFLRGKVAAAERDMAESAYYDGGFYQGIDNAVGGAAGELAALFSPEVAGMVADLLEEVERQQNQRPCDAPGGACNACSWRPDFVVAEVLAELVKGVHCG
ncbi:hypothetical protein ABT294_00740 [Nonomuraea sp. NPDC000554]|uniref:hypothetical protein n=1 Tax=Nonomuraea sp. NPDC000554 TaxID=3154259 RepID=UPI0033317EC1